MKRRNFFKWSAFFGFAAVFTGGGMRAVKTNTNPYYDGPSSDHFDGLQFFNPKGKHPKGFAKLIKWLMSDRPKWPKSFPSPFKDKPPVRVYSDELRVSFVGHATILIQTAGLNILTDPVWSERVSPFSFAGPKRVNPPGMNLEDLPPIDLILISHNHYDHLDIKTLDKLIKAHNPVILCPLGNDTIIRKKIRKARTIAKDWGDSFGPGNGVAITLEPMHHWSARGTTDRRNALWAAFVIQTPGGAIYHIGDTGFHEGVNYREVQAKYGEFRLAILPFGAYEPRDFMKAQHQNPNEAVQGHLLCNAKQTLGHHWGTFQLTNESIDDQLNHLAEARIRHGVSEEKFRALRPGQVWDVSL
jgi:L-ascorbate metabolism protein UlaG (beta-lactamase superfamily)